MENNFLTALEIANCDIIDIDFRVTFYREDGYLEKVLDILRNKKNLKGIKIKRGNSLFFREFVGRDEQCLDKILDALIDKVQTIHIIRIKVELCQLVRMLYTIRELNLKQDCMDLDTFSYIMLLLSETPNKWALFRILFDNPKNIRDAVERGEKEYKNCNSTITKFTCIIKTPQGTVNALQMDLITSVIDTNSKLRDFVIPDVYTQYTPIQDAYRRNYTIFSHRILDNRLMDVSKRNIKIFEVVKRSVLTFILIRFFRRNRTNLTQSLSRLDKNIVIKVAKLAFEARYDKKNLRFLAVSLGLETEEKYKKIQ